MDIHTTCFVGLIIYREEIFTVKKHENSFNFLSKKETEVINFYKKSMLKRFCKKTYLLNKIKTNNKINSIL